MTNRIVPIVSVLLALVVSPAGWAQDFQNAEPFDLQLSPKAGVAQAQLAPPFRVVRTDASWVLLEHRPELRVTIVFNKAPDVASLQAGISLVGGPTHAPRWFVRNIRNTDDVSVVQLAPGPDEYGRRVAYGSRLRLD